MKEVSPLKQNLLMINKADMLTLEQRQAWAQYLDSIGVKFAFFSAITEEDVEDDEDEGEEVHESSDDDEGVMLGDAEEVVSEDGEDVVSEDHEEVVEKNTDETKESDSVQATEVTSQSNVADFCSTDVLTCAQLVSVFRAHKRHASELVTVGFIGYPNVGKSSTINKLLSAKKVRVSETPGKTKHFQTLVLEEDVTLCDCPGLVSSYLAVSDLSPSR